MNNYQLISFDMDGTLLSDDKILSEKTKDAVNRAIQAGKTVIIATGRTPSELQDYEESFQDIRYYVCENGAVVYDSFEKKVLSATPIAEDLIDRILELAKQEDTMLYIGSNGRNLVNKSDVLRMEYFSIECYKELALRTAVLTEDIYAEYYRQRFPIEKLNIHSHTPQMRDRLLSKLEKLPLTVVYAEANGLEVSPLHMSKAVGFKNLCRHLSIDLSQTIAVGDADNDIELLKTAGLSVAMGNAKPHVKEICDVVVADNNHDGCAEAVDRYLLA